MKKLTLSLSTILLLSNLSCATKPPDIKLCVEMSMDRGECMRVVSGQKIRIDEANKNPDSQQTWWEMRPTNLVLPLESWVDLKKFIIKLCKKNKNMCEKEVSTWERSLQTVDDGLKEKGR